LAVPEKRDNINRPALEKPEVDSKEVAERKYKQWQYQMELYRTLDPDYTGMDWRDNYMLADDEWNHDPIPQFLDGKNIMDFWSEDIETKLEELEREEVQRLRELEEELEKLDLSRFELTPDQKDKVQRIREKKKQLIIESRKKKDVDGPNLPMKFNPKKLTVTDFEQHLENLGMDGSRAAQRMRSQSRDRSESRGRAKEKVDELKKKREISMVPSAGEGFQSEKEKLLGQYLARRSVKQLTQDGRKGESDRHVFDLKPKHLFSGKRTVGKTDRR